MSWRNHARAFDDALSGRVPTDGEIAALVAAAERICALAAEVVPSPVFVQSLRTSLMTETATALAPAAAFVAAPQQATASALWQRVAAQSKRRISLLLAGLVTAFGLVGMSSASASALPGDLLYPVKRSVENAELSLQRDDSARGALLLDLASRRLDEVQGLTQRSGVPTDLKATTLDEYRDQADQGSDSLVKSFKATKAKGDIVAINRFATRASKGLDRLDGRLSGTAAVSLDSALAQLSALVALAARLCPDCGGIDPALVAALTQPAAPAAPAAPVPAAPGQPAPPAVPAATKPSAQEEEPSEESERVETVKDVKASSSPESEPESDPEPDPEPEPEPDPEPQPDPNDGNNGGGDDNKPDKPKGNNGNGNGRGNR